MGRDYVLVAIDFALGMMQSDWGKVERERRGLMEWQSLEEQWQLLIELMPGGVRQVRS